MRCNLEGLLRQAARCIDPKLDTSAYAYMLGEEVADHITDVRAGKYTAAEFCEHYGITPEPTQ